MRALPTLDVSPSTQPPRRDPGTAEDAHAARPARRSAVERLAADRAKYVRGTPGLAGRDPASEDRGPVAPRAQHSALASPAHAPANVARRTIARKPLRPDSLVMYRQKCGLLQGPGADGSRGGIAKRLFQGPSKDKAPTPPETAAVAGENRAREEEALQTRLVPAASHPTPRAPVAPAATPESPGPLSAPKAPAASPGVDLLVSRRRGLQRSQSDLSSRYSLARAEFDPFFQFCGLDPEVVEALGRENFSAGSDHVALRVRSVSVATSDSGFSRHSEEGLQEEEVMEQVRSTTSVVERNARIIKWLFTCRKAKETPNQGFRGSPDQSPVSETP